jgi:hypothetical protein
MMPSEITVLPDEYSMMVWVSFVIFPLSWALCIILSAITERLRIIGARKDLTYLEGT